ncbi:MAG: PQQ-dependent sugar dehydrogenase [Proteobacteria bacterium]|nr:PQQ-dependent sugar dehydrogenase [Pseudomonadota bacterium]
MLNRWLGRCCRVTDLRGLRSAAIVLTASCLLPVGACATNEATVGGGATIGAGATGGGGPPSGGGGAPIGFGGAGAGAGTGPAGSSGGGIPGAAAGTAGGIAGQGPIAGARPIGGAGGAPAVAGCVPPLANPTPGNACKGVPPPRLKLTPITSGLSVPVYVTHAPGDRMRLFVVERTGFVRVLQRDPGPSSTWTLSPAPFLDVSRLIATGSGESEQGLLGLAFDPQYATTGRFWINYSARGSGDTVVAGYRTAANNPNAADPGSATVLLQVEQPQSNHNGGMLAFGPDGCLWIGLGDGGGRNDGPNHGPMGHGQDPATQLGSMLRIDVANYPTPAPGNPPIPGADPHVWSYGWRNPWRYSFDRETGDLYAGDVGQNAWEEIDVEPRGVAGRNYGWNVMEGKHCLGDRTGAGSCVRTGLTLPVVEVPNENRIGSISNPNRSITGGYVYRGSIPGMAGRYVYGDFGSRRIWSFVWRGETNGVAEICDEVELTQDLQTSNLVGISSFGEDADGELYVVDFGGSIVRIDPE